MKTGITLKAMTTLIATCTALTIAGCNKPKDVPNPAAPQAQKVPAAQELRTDDVKLGEGPAATKGKIVHIRYTGYLPDGTRFDSNHDRKPLQFQLGQGTVLKGWDLGIEGMKVGGKRKLTVPPALAFGGREVGQIKPNSTLTFDVELVEIQ